MSKRPKSNGVIIFHVIMTLLTGGLWLIVPAITYFVRRSR